MADTTATELEAEEPSVDPVELLTTGDLAKRLRVSIRQIRKLHSEALLPAPLKIGRSSRWRATELAEWLSAGAPRRAEWEKQLESMRIGE